MATRTSAERTRHAEEVARGVKALAHPVRVQIVELVGEEGELSPSQLHGRLGGKMSLSNVSYHVQQLVAVGMLRRSRTRPRRGAVEHFYVQAPRAGRVLDAVSGAAAQARRSVR